MRVLDHRERDGYNNSLIITLTVNPALDLTIFVERLAFEDRTYIESRRESAGGRGINAACVIHGFGGKPQAIFPSGGKKGKCLEGLVGNYGYPTVAVPIRHEIRTNLTITDRQGLTVSLNERGPQLEKAEVDRLERAVHKSLDGAAWLMLCGSTPPGVPPSFYGKLIGAARKKKVKTLLHTSGEALREGIEAHPSVVTPNQQEAERLLGGTLLTRTQFLEAAEQVRKMGAESVVLSLGSRGAVGAFADGLVAVASPPVDSVCPIGSGDALAAAYAWAMFRKAKPAEAMRWGVAAGTASARLPGMRFATLAQTEEIFPRVEARRVE